MSTNVEIRPRNQIGGVTVQIPNSTRLQKISKRIEANESATRDLKAQLFRLSSRAQALDQSNLAESSVKLATLKREIAGVQRQIAILDGRLERDRDELSQWRVQIATAIHRRKLLWQEYAESFAGPPGDSPIVWMSSAPLQRSKGDVRRELSELLKWLLAFSGYDKAWAEELAQLQAEEKRQ